MLLCVLRLPPLQHYAATHSRTHTCCSLADVLPGSWRRGHLPWEGDGGAYTASQKASGFVLGGNTRMAATGTGSTGSAHGLVLVWWCGRTGQSPVTVPPLLLWCWTVLPSPPPLAGQFSSSYRPNLRLNTKISE